jgi:CHAT domain-containing protein
VHQAHRSTLAATELQVHVAARARELAETGLELALQSGRPSSIFDWAERWRAGSLLNRPVRPPKDALLAERLTQLRAVSADLEVARLSGDDVSKVRRQQLALERAIAARARLLAPELTQSSAVTSSQLQASLGDRALIEFIHLGDEIVAVVVDDARMTLHELGSARAVHDELQHMRFGIKRLAARDSGPLAAAAAASVRAAAATVDGCLLGPLSARLQGRPLVIVPTGAMHGLPWDLLPSLSLQPLTVAPSASVWRLARERSYVGGAVATVVAGPGLPGAAREVAAVAAVHGPRTRLFHGEAATAGAVLQALEGVFLAHLATHGHFRSDNPLFSALTVADGELTVYDLEGLETPPSIVVLSACDSGLSAVHPGDELMGLSAALLRMGTKTLVASIAPVPDDVAERTMASLHAGLAIGLAPATALAEARKELNESDRIRAASLVCFGAG